MVTAKELLEMKNEEAIKIEKSKKSIEEYLDDIRYGLSLLNIPDDVLVEIADRYDLTIIDPATQEELYGGLINVSRKRIIYTDILDELIRINNDPNFKIEVHYMAKTLIYNKIHVVNTHGMLSLGGTLTLDISEIDRYADGRLIGYANIFGKHSRIDLTNAKAVCMFALSKK